jgi:hypothetical protein
MQASLKRTLAAVAIAASAAVFCASTAQAAVSYTFANGLGTGAFTIGDKLFSSFSCSGDNCQNVTYRPLTDGSYGVDFNPAGALNFFGLNGENRVRLVYEVSTTDGSFRIADFFLSSDAVATGSGASFVQDNVVICRDSACQLGDVILDTLLETTQSVVARYGPCRRAVQRRVDLRHSDQQIDGCPRFDHSARQGRDAGARTCFSGTGRRGSACDGVCPAKRDRCKGMHWRSGSPEASVSQSM